MLRNYAKLEEKTKSGDLRHGNVKFNDQSLTLRDQEKYQTAKSHNNFVLEVIIFDSLWHNSC